MAATVTKPRAKAQPKLAIPDAANPLLSCEIVIFDPLEGSRQSVPARTPDFQAARLLALQVAEEHPRTTSVEVRLLNAGVKVMAREAFNGRLPAAPQPVAPLWKQVLRWGVRKWL